MVGIKDVAKRAGVSIATVSNVINKRKAVSEELTAKVNEAIEALGYEVNPVGRGLKSNVTNQIGVIVPSFNQVFFTPVLKAIQETAEEYKLQVLVFETGGSVEKEREHVSYLRNAGADGIILASLATNENISEREYIRSLGHMKNRKKAIPVITLENLLDPRLSAVVIDNEKTARIAMSHLLEKSHKRIAYIGGPLKFHTGKHRRKGYEDSLFEKGITVDESLIKEGDYSPKSGYKAMKELLNGKPDFTAVFAANDQMAIGAMKALMDSGKTIPKDVAVIGMDNSFPSSLVSPTLTTVDIPKYEMGKEAMDLLVERIKNPNLLPEVRILDTKLIVRKSTDPDGDNFWDLENW